jgi:hypothetical protein
MPLAPTRSPVGRAERTGAPGTDFQALAPARVPGCPRAINPRLAGGSPGIFPFQGLRRLPCPHFRTDLPSRAWRAKPEGNAPPAPQGVDRQPTGPTQRLNSEPLETLTRTTLLGFLCLLGPTRWERRRPGLCVHLVGNRALPPSVPTLWGCLESVPTGALRDQPRALESLVTCLDFMSSSFVFERLFGC